MNLADPELELLDPTPNIHLLFVQFDKTFFESKLASRAVVRWSKRMYSCAGICSYEGRGGLCDVALSEPLLKLRPRKDLIETLLHEMIHAYLFVTCKNQDRDGHGPNFKYHMHRINKAAGINITIYHSFHNEVELYQTHWWRCNGPCQNWKPYYGVVKRSANMPPGPKEYWWNSHLRRCGGTFTKIKEPENYRQKKRLTKPKENITKYINIKTINDVTKPINNKPPNKILKTIDNNISAITKSNNSSTILVKENKNKSSPKIEKPRFSGVGQTINGNRKRSKSVDVTETVRNIWANKQIIGISSGGRINGDNININSSANKNKQKAIIHGESPPKKIKKIDEYFKNVANSVLKDIYGHDIKVTQSNLNNKLTAMVLTKPKLVSCPLCCFKIDETKINSHLDECLNTDIIAKISAESSNVNTQKNNNLPNVENAIDNIGFENDFLNKIPKNSDTNELDNAVIYDFNTKTTTSKPNIKEPESNSSESQCFDKSAINKVNALVKKINFEKKIRKSDNFIITKEKPNQEVNIGYLPSFISDEAREINMPSIKLEPGTSKDIKSDITEQKCPCCDNKLYKSIAEHLDECQIFLVDSKTMQEEGASTSFANETIVLDDDEDDIFDETQTLNATGTKTPCPCCLEMVEDADMNEHLEKCLC